MDPRPTPRPSSRRRFAAAVAAAAAVAVTIAFPTACSRTIDEEDPPTLVESRLEPCRARCEEQHAFFTRIPATGLDYPCTDANDMKMHCFWSTPSLEKVED